jgi:hypothetical protein
MNGIVQELPCQNVTATYDKLISHTDYEIFKPPGTPREAQATVTQVLAEIHWIALNDTTNGKKLSAERRGLVENSQFSPVLLIFCHWLWTLERQK